MSDEEENVEDKPFAAEIAKQGRAVCKICKQKCLQGELRIAKLVHNPFGSGKMKAWHHLNCLFEAFLKQRQTTKRIEEPEDIDGWDKLCEDDQNIIIDKIKECDKAFQNKFGAKPNKSPTKKKSPQVTQQSPKQKKNLDKVDKKNESPGTTDSANSSPTEKTSKDQLFKQFRRLVADITNTSSYIDKTNCVKKIFTEGSDGSGFKDNIVLWCRLLLPGVVKRVYNLQSKQLIKLFSKIFVQDQNEMLEHLEQGDIGETIQNYFEDSHKTKPAKKSLLKVKEVDNFLNKLSKLTKEDDQMEHFRSFVPKCTSNDLKTVIRLIKGDLRMGAGAKHILDGVHTDAYEAYQTSRDLETVITKCLGEHASQKKKKNVGVTVMTPVLPMLAEACKSVEQAMKKCPNGMYSEIKYDGERVQVHKQGSEFKYYSRALKPVMPHKIQHFKDYIPKAFPHAKDLILDSEILMMDTETGKPLPFGTLGVHKKAEFKNASVCLFVFDCIYYNGESLIQKPIKQRRKILQENMKEIPNHIVFSEMEEIHKPEDLSRMIAKVLKLGLEGLVLKDIQSIYEPGKRHWLKVKKDYLFGGAMADSADLMVLGAWYGTGKKGGMMSVFLMGCFNPESGKFCTVTKVHTGHDDKTLEKLQDELDMVKISQDSSKVPNWLSCTKTMIPDFVARDPKKQPVWEITGAEFTQHDVHTADGISIRFPRVTRIRDDKNWETATNLPQLQKLFKTSKEQTDVSLLMKGIDNAERNDKEENLQKCESPPKKRKKEKQVNFDDGDDESPSTSKKKKKKTNDSDRLNSIVDEKQNDNIEFSNKPKKRSPKASEKMKKESSIDIANPIPDYFTGIKALLEDNLKRDEYSDVARYITTYGGIVLSEDQWKEASHVIHYHNIIREPDIKCPYSAKHLAYEWVKDSVAQGTLCDYRLYTVQWDPEA
ncbi:DNA ligase 3 [Leptinotarsa decemlineata]|uniref:DNA ligase 3 n=1 Tax=Leptinotarsa decemlineata TaxID=7539 RepID=UPI003D305E9C